MSSPLSAPAAPSKEEVTFENDMIFHGAVAYFLTLREHHPLDDIVKYDIIERPFVKRMKENYQMSLDKTRDVYNHLPEL